jgi:hypothetical protein
LRDDFGICIKNNHRVTASGCLRVSLIHPLIQQRRKLKLETPSSELDTFSYKLEKFSLKLETPSSELDTFSFELGNLSFELETPSSELETSCFELETPSSELETSCFELKTPSSDDTSSRAKAASTRG